MNCLHFGFCCWNWTPSLFVRKQKFIFGGLCLWPPNILEGKWTTMVDESTLNLTVILHGTTQTRCIVVHKATDNASQPPKTSLATISSVPSRLFDTKCCSKSTTTGFIQPIQRENKILTSLFDYMQSSFVTLGNLLYSVNCSHQSTSTCSTCVNVPSALMFAMEPPLT